MEVPFPTILSPLMTQEASSPDPSSSPKHSLSHRMGMLGFLSFEKLLSSLPMGLLCHIGRVAGGIAFFMLPSRRRIVERNLRIVIDSSLQGKKLKELARENFKRMGMNMLAAAKTATMSDEELPKYVTIEGHDGFEEKQLRGESTICAVVHSGNWEVLARIRTFFPNIKHYGSMYRQMDNPLMEEYLYRRRTEAGTEMFSKEDGTHRPLVFLKNNAALGILCDQFVQEGVHVPYFGKVTGTTYLPALLHKRTKADVNAVSVRSEKTGHWISDMCNFVDLNSCDQSFAGMTTAINKGIERLLSLSPLDGFWMHHRWKITNSFAPQDAKTNRFLETLDLKPMRIMVATPHDFDEALLVVPLVKALRAARCDIQVNIICPEEQRGFWKTIPEVTHIVCGSGEKELVAALSDPTIYDDGPYDLGMMLDGKKEATLALDEFAPLSFSGFASHPMVKKAHFRNVVPNFRAKRLYHRMQDYLRLLDSHDIPSANPAFFPTPRQQSAMDAPIALAPFSTLGDSNEWSKEHWQTVVSRLNGKAFLVALPHDLERAENLAQMLNVDCVCLPPEELLPVLRNARKVIASDGLIPALTAHEGTPCVVLFGSRIPARYRPLGAQHQCLHVHFPCAGCLRPQCTNKTKCINEISPADVLNALALP